MAFVNLVEEARRRRQTVPGLQAPAEAAPAPTASPAVPDASRAAMPTAPSGWNFDQETENAYRAAHPDQRFDATSANLKPGIDAWLAAGSPTQNAISHSPGYLRRTVEVIVHRRRCVSTIPEEPEHEREPGHAGEVGVKARGHLDEPRADQV